jgi:malonate transporter MadL subunit
VGIAFSGSAGHDTGNFRDPEKGKAMVIYGVALLSFCMLVGVFVGDLLGDLIGVQANVGGVGIAMLLLIFLSNLSHTKFSLGEPTERGIGFWSAMYIPIVVAMAAKQNVIAAISSGWMAIIAGVAAVVVSFAMIPVLSKFGSGDQHDS